MRIDFILCFLCFFVWSGKLNGQYWDFKKNAEVVTIPFDLTNHIILLPVMLNGEPLTFILDTGVKETLLFGSVDSIRLKNVSTFNFQGLGIEDGIQGLLSFGNVLALGDSMLVDHSHDLYVIVDSTVNLSKNIGVPIHGILGAVFFQNHVVKIDYVKRKMQVRRSLSDQDKVLKRYTAVPLDLIKDRPFVEVNMVTKENDFENIRMLVDLGNSDPLMLFSTELEGLKITEPSVYEFIGQGFNGNIYGKRNRISRVSMAGFTLNRPFASYPDQASYQNRKLVERRVGSIGNQIMSRFDVIFDYADSCMYIKKNKNFSKPFNIDMSGIEVRHEGFTWLKSRVDATPERKASQNAITIDLGSEVNYHIQLVPSYVINHVRDNSPAYTAGLRDGDRLEKINGRQVGKMTLAEIKERMQLKDNYLIQLEIKRNDVTMKFSFRLVDPIP